MAASPEALLISAVLRTKDAKAFNKQGMSVEMFDVFPDEFTWLKTYIDRYQSTPTKQTFKAKFDDFTIFAVDEVEHHCEAVKEAYSRRAMTDLFDKSVDHLLKGNVQKAIELMQSEALHIQAVTQDAIDDYDVVTDWGDTYDKAVERVAKVDAGLSAGIPSGFPTLDLNTGGYQPGWYCIQGGRLSAGKTWSMLRQAHEAAMGGYTSLYYSLEQPKDQIALRSHVLLSRSLPGQQFRHLDLMRGTSVDLVAYKKFLASLEERLPGRFVINDTSRGRVGPMTVAAGIEREQPDIVFIDYLTLMKQTGDGGWLSVADLSASLQQLAQRYNVPVIVGSQLNRTAMGDDEPDAGKIGRSDAVGQDADIVVMVAAKTPSVRKFTLAKNRHGPDNLSWNVRWKPNVGDIEEISGDEAAALIEEDKTVD